MPIGNIHINLVVFLLFLGGQLCAQDYIKIDQTVKQYPSSWDSPEALAEQINEDFSKPAEKARAIYDWIAYNIAYDIQTYLSGDLYTAPYYIHSLIHSDESYYREDLYRIYLAEEALFNKKTLCEGYASLYKRLCDLTGLDGVIIPGYVKIFPKDIGHKPTTANHTWNAVKIDGQWKLLDVTWGAGVLNYDKKIFIPHFSDIYFFTPPDRFFLQHCPQKSYWSFTGKTMQDFMNLPFYYREYMTYHINIIAPVKGIIPVPGKTRIKFRIESLPKDIRVSYSTWENESYRQIYPAKRKHLSTFSITITTHAGPYLTLFMDQHAIATYKLIK